MARGARLARIARRVGLGLVALIAMVLAGVLLALHSPWGRDQLRRRLEAALADRVDGAVTIGRLDGSVLGELVARQVAITDLSGRAVIEVDTVRVDAGLLALLDRRLHLSRLVIDGAEVIALAPVPGEHGEAGLRSLLDVLSPPPTGPPSSSGWAVAIDHLQLKDVTVLWSDGRREGRIEGVGGTGRVAVGRGAAGVVRATVDLRGRWREREAWVALAGDVEVDGDQIFVPAARASLGRAQVRVRGLRAGPGALTGGLAADVPADAWPALLPGRPLIGDVHAEASVAWGAAPGSLDVTVTGDLAGSAVRGMVTVYPVTRRVRGNLAVDGLDASALVRGATPTAIDGHVAIDAGAARYPRPISVSTVAGGAWLRLAGLAGGARVDELVATIGARDGWLALAAGAIGPGRATLRASALAALTPAAIELAAARVVAEVPDLAAVTSSRAVRGAVVADLRARGRLGTKTRLDVAGTVRGRRLAGSGLAARTADVTLDTRDLLGRPGGHAVVALDGVVAGGEAVGRVRVDARSIARGRIAFAARSWPPVPGWAIDVDGVAELALPAVRVALGRWRLQTHDVDWVGHGGTVAIEPARIVARGLQAQLDGGTLTADAGYQRLAAGGRRAGDLELTARAAGVDLAALDRALDLGGAVGRADVDIDVVRRAGRVRGSADVALRGLGRTAGGPTLDLATSVNLTPGRITIDGALAAGAAGTATFGVAVTPPRRLTDPAAWRRLEGRSLSAELVVPRLDLAGLARIAGVADPQVRGTVEGRLAWTEAATGGTLRVRDLITRTLPAGADAELTLAPAGDRLAITADVDLRTIGDVDLAATIALPARPLDLGAWARLDRTAIEGGSVRATDLDLAGVTGVLGLPAGWTGRGQLAVDVAAGLRDARITAGLHGVRGGPLEQAADVDVRATADGTAIAGEVTARVAGLTAVTGRGTIGLGLDGLHAGGPAALRAAPIDATVTMDDVALTPLLRLVGRRERVAGTVDLTATARGTVGAPAVDATGSIAGLRLDRRDLGRLDADLRFDGAVAVATVRGDQPGGGRLQVDARYPVAAPATATATVAATRFDVAALAVVAPVWLRDLRGVLEADVRVDGADPATATIAGTVRVREAELPIAALVGTLRDAAIDLAVRRDRLVVRANGRLGDGRARLDGIAVLDGLIPERAEARLVVDDVVLLDELQPTVDARVEATVRRTGPGWPWRARVEVTDAKVVLPEERGATLAPIGVPDDVELVGDRGGEPERTRAAAPGAPRPPFLIATIELEPVEIRSEDVRGSIGGTLTASLSPDDVQLEGNLEGPQGVITLFGRRYRVERAEVTFDGPIDPRVDVRLVHDFPELTLFVEVRGRASSPEVTLRSDPATFNQGELFGILVGGEPRARNRPVAENATGAATSLVSQQVVDYVTGYLPIKLDVVSVQAPTGTAGASLTIGKWVSRSLFVAYRQRLEARPDQNSGELEIEYWLRARLVLEGVVGDRGVNGLDLLWTRRW